MKLVTDIEIIKKVYREYLYELDPSMKFYCYLVNNGFFKVPASAGHHLNIDGGLAIHSYSVFRYALLQRQIVKVKRHKKENYGIVGIPVLSIIKCALLHDVFKMFLYEKKKGKWQYKDDGTTKRHGKWSVEIIETFIELTEQEKEMIEWHMGPYTDYYDWHKQGDFLEWSNDKKNENKNAALFLYFCDHFSTMFLED